MLCERCHKNVASLRYSEVVNGKVAVRNICPACLGEIQGDAATAFEMTGAPHVKRAVAPPEEPEPATTHRTCPSCGVGLRTVLKTGRMGCAVCYRSFGEAIEPQLRGLQTAVGHRGKKPRMDDARQKLRADIQSKRALLRTAVRMEKYEEAALLRDTIKALETGLSNQN